MNTPTARGYTLVELIISVAIFSIVMLSASAAYLSFVAYNRRADAIAALTTTLSFAVDSMARDMRSGTGYSGGSGVRTFSFTDSSDCHVTYAYKTTTKVLTRTELSGSLCHPSSVGGDEFIGPNVTPGITLNSVLFYVQGNASGDTVQPIVTIVLKGTASVPNSSDTIPFSIETSATQRLPDL